jgi:hypothetical protein
MLSFGMFHARVSHPTHEGRNNFPLECAPPVGALADFFRRADVQADLVRHRWHGPCWARVEATWCLADSPHFAHSGDKLPAPSWVMTLTERQPDPVMQYKREKYTDHESARRSLWPVWTFTETVEMLPFLVERP